MDDILEVGLRNIFKFIKGLIKDFIYDLVFYAIGWVVLRVLTLGSYPQESLGDGLRDPESSESMPNIIGLILVSVLIFWIFK